MTSSVLKEGVLIMKNKKLLLAISAVLLLTVVSSVFAITEEEILVPETKQRLLYSLSNNLGEIEQAIIARTGYKVDLGSVQWRLNTGLSASVKNLMNKHNVNYSMTTWKEDGADYIIVNKRAGNEWYVYSATFGGGFYPEAILEQKEAVIYSDGAGDGEHLLAVITVQGGIKLVAYYVVEFMYKNTVEAGYFGYSQFESNYLYFEEGLGTVSIKDSSTGKWNDFSLNLTVFDVDEKKGTITVRYDYGSEKIFPERARKLSTFKRTKKFQGKKFLIGK
jgi:hypothetical protein